MAGWGMAWGYDVYGAASPPRATPGCLPCLPTSPIRQRKYLALSLQNLTSQINKVIYKLENVIFVFYLLYFVFCFFLLKQKWIANYKNEENRTPTGDFGNPHTTTILRSFIIGLRWGWRKPSPPPPPWRSPGRRSSPRLRTCAGWGLWLRHKAPPGRLYYPVRSVENGLGLRVPLTLGRRSSPSKPGYVRGCFAAPP